MALVVAESEGSDSEDEFADEHHLEPAVADPFAQLEEWRDAAFGRDAVLDDVTTTIGDMLAWLESEDAAQIPRIAAAAPASQLALSPLIRRQIVERQFPLMTVDMLDQCSYHPSMAERHDIRVHADNARRDIISKPRLHRQDGEWREEQRSLMAADTPAKMRSLLDQRRHQVSASLSTNYLRVRVAVIAMFVAFTMECLHQWPFFTHWPEDRGEDAILLDFVTYLSIRYTSFACVKAAFGHVIEFHYSFLQVSPPPLGFPRTRWFLSKLKLTMAKEKPEGRKRRPGLPGRFVNRILHRIRQLVDSSRPASYMQKLYVNAGAALAFAFEQAMRVGNICPGLEFRPDWHLSRETIKGVLAPVSRLRGLDWIVVQAPVTKTTFTSAAARERTTRPRLVDPQCRQWYGFVNWGELLATFDPLTPGENAGATPAFRMGGKGSPALTYHQACRIMKLAAADTVPNWRNFDYGGHSLRIGRVNDMIAAKNASGDRLADDEQLNGWSMHTATSGRAAYDRAEIHKDLRLMRAAEKTHFTAVETVQAFPQHRGAHRSVVSGKIATAHSADPQTAAQTPIDLQAELEQDTEAANTVDMLDAPPQWEGEPLRPQDTVEIQHEMESPHPTHKRSTAVAPPPTDTPAAKKRKFFDFRTGRWVDIPQQQRAPAQRTEGLDKLRRNMCEICGLKSKNYGPRGGRKQWCAKCGKLRGATLHCM
jgi:hypothetical protein